MKFVDALEILGLGFDELTPDSLNDHYMQKSSKLEKLKSRNKNSLRNTFHINKFKEAFSYVNSISDDISCICKSLDPQSFVSNKSLEKKGSYPDENLALITEDMSSFKNFLIDLNSKGMEEVSNSDFSLDFVFKQGEFIFPKWTDFDESTFNDADDVSNLCNQLADLKDEIDNELVIKSIGSYKQINALETIDLAKAISPTTDLVVNNNTISEISSDSKPKKILKIKKSSKDKDFFPSTSLDLSAQDKNEKSSAIKSSVDTASKTLTSTLTTSLSSSAPKIHAGISSSSKKSNPKDKSEPDIKLFVDHIEADIGDLLNAISINSKGEISFDETEESLKVKKSLVDLVTNQIKDKNFSSKMNEKVVTSSLTFNAKGEEIRVQILEDKESQEVKKKSKVKKDKSSESLNKIKDEVLKKVESAKINENSPSNIENVEPKSSMLEIVTESKVDKTPSRSDSKPENKSDEKKLSLESKIEHKLQNAESLNEKKNKIDSGSYETPHKNNIDEVNPDHKIANISSIDSSQSSDEETFSIDLEQVFSPCLTTVKLTPKSECHQVYRSVVSKIYNILLKKHSEGKSKEEKFHLKVNSIRDIIRDHFISSIENSKIPQIEIIINFSIHEPNSYFYLPPVYAEEVKKLLKVEFINYLPYHRCITPINQRINNNQKSLSDKKLVILKLLFNNPYPIISMNKLDHEGLPLLHRSIVENDEPSFNLIVDLIKCKDTNDSTLSPAHGLNLNTRCESRGWAPIHYATFKLRKNFIDKLYKEGANMQVTTSGTLPNWHNDLSVYKPPSTTILYCHKSLLDPGLKPQNILKYLINNSKLQIKQLSSGLSNGSNDSPSNGSTYNKKIEIDRLNKKCKDAEEILELFNSCAGKNISKKKRKDETHDKSFSNIFDDKIDNLSFEDLNIETTESSSTHFTLRNKLIEMGYSKMLSSIASEKFNTFDEAIKWLNENDSDSNLPSPSNSFFSYPSSSFFSFNPLADLDLISTFPNIKGIAENKVSLPPGLAPVPTLISSPSTKPSLPPGLKNSAPPGLKISQLPAQISMTPQVITASPIKSDISSVDSDDIHPSSKNSSPPHSPRQTINYIKLIQECINKLDIEDLNPKPSPLLKFGMVGIFSTRDSNYFDKYESSLKNISDTIISFLDI